MSLTGSAELRGRTNAQPALLPPGIHPDTAAAVALPRLIGLDDGVIGAAFDVMKVLPAQRMIDRAVSSGEIGPETVVVETTSGTFGLALAMVCVSRGIRLHIVTDPTADEDFCRRMTDLGARVTVVRDPLPQGGLQAARLRVVDELCGRYPDCYVPSQYSNPDNPLAYENFAQQALRQIGHIDCVVGTVGSGGSMAGTCTALLKALPELRIVGVDTHRSRLFGQDDGPRLLRGLGNSLMPPNVSHALFDEVHWVGAAEAFMAARQLYARHALYQGPTSGAAYLVARHVAKELPGRRILVILPDSGHRYSATVYNDTWLTQNVPGLDSPRQFRLPERPTAVSRPPREGSGWLRMEWGRRTLDDVMSGPGTGSPSYDD